MLRKKPVEFQADGGVSLIGLPILIVALLVGAIALGWLASFIGQWFYLVFFFPIGLGFGLVLVGVAVAGLAKMRNIALGALLGLIAGVLTMVTMHFFDYWRTTAGVPGAASVTFLQYMDRQATEGVVIGSRGGGFNLGYVGSWVYWIVEMLIVAGISLLGMAGSAMNPFCVKCDRWKDERKLGTVDHDNPDLIKGYFTEGDLESLREFIPLTSIPGRFHFTAHVCPNCRHREAIVVKLEDKTSDGQGQESTTELAQLTFPGAALRDFESMFGISRPRDHHDEDDDDEDRDDRRRRRYRDDDEDDREDREDRGRFRRSRDDRD